MKNTIIVIALGITTMLYSCSIANPKLFASVTESGIPTYGYSIDDPVLIKNSNLNKSIRSSHYYISRLRTGNGNRLKLLYRASVINPNYRKPINPTNRYTGRPLNNGNGPLLDLYAFIPENESDTIRIYINPYKKGEIMTPSGLVFENE